jgi:hypothetical protein
MVFKYITAIITQVRGGKQQRQQPEGEGHDDACGVIKQEEEDCSWGS